MSDKETSREGFQAVSEAEAAILKALWNRGACSPRQLRESLVEDGRTWAYTTVQTLLHRLLGKGFVLRSRQGSSQVYRARCSPEEVLRAHMDDLADRICDGRTSLLVQSLVKGRSFSSEELARFRELLDDAEETSEAEDGSAT